MTDPSLFANSRARSAVPLKNWPDADRRAWALAITPGDLLEPGGIGAAWRPATRDGACNAYGRWLAWRARQGPLDEHADPAERVTEQAITDYVQYLCAQHSLSSAAAYLAFLAMALRALAPDRAWGWIGKIATRLRRNATPVRAKRPRLQSTDALLSFGIELMDGAAREPEPVTWRTATGCRDGLMIALLALRPLRRRNFIAIQLGRHLVRVGPDYRLRFEGADTKNGRWIDEPFPAPLTDRLERYLQHYRPWLCAQDSHRNPRIRFQPPGDHLWVSKTGAAMSEDVFYKDLRNRTRERFGQALSPHLFRDCAATTIATEDPAHVAIIPALLGHTTAQTSERYYNHAGMIDAGRRVQDVVAKLRHAGTKDQEQRPCVP
ncbi:MAG: site-specific integrase [Nevskia sp.]|nr:site-specific integrase [Nevskia sp.]